MAYYNLYFVLIVLLIASSEQQLTKKANLFSLQGKGLTESWRSFKVTFRKKFDNRSVEFKRLGVFKSNLKSINEHNEKFNQGNVTYVQGITAFTDWTSEEFMAYVNRGIILKNPKQMSNYTLKNKVSSLPASVDWRNEGYVADVRNQGQCGNCWTFSAVAAIEGQYFKTNGRLLKFSEQQLTDCVYLSQGKSGTSADGCNGGWMTEAFDYLKKAPGIATESDYSFKSGSTGKWSGSCKTIKTSAQITDYVEVATDEKAVTEALATKGPVTVALYVTSNFQNYVSGVFTDTTCGNNRSPNHAVNFVGYGTENGQDYYILRNSWGTSWGLGGYMWIRRNFNNMCGIASYVSYPIVKKNSSPNPTTSRPTTTSAATTTSTAKITTTTATTTVQPQPIVTTTNSVQPTVTTQSQSVKCNAGTGWYTAPGCQIAYYCEQKITNYRCQSGYLFDPTSGSCKLNSKYNCTF